MGSVFTCLVLYRLRIYFVLQCISILSQFKLNGSPGCVKKEIVEKFSVQYIEKYFQQ